MILYLAYLRVVIRPDSLATIIRADHECRTFLPGHQPPTEKNPHRGHLVIIVVLFCGWLGSRVVSVLESR